MEFPIKSWLLLDKKLLVLGRSRRFTQLEWKWEEKLIDAGTCGGLEKR